MVYDPFARPENVYTPEALAVVVAVDVPVNAMVAPLPDVPTPPVMVQADAAMLSEKVLTVLPALAARAATVTLAGTVRYALLLAKATANPPVSAAELSVTVHAETPPELTLEGVHVRPV